MVWRSASMEVLTPASTVMVRSSISRANISVVAHHVANREEFLPPLEVLAAADCNVVPYTVSGLGNRTRLQNAVGVSQTTLDTGILAVNVAKCSP